MTTAEKIHHINQVLKEYFDRHPEASPIPAKDFMPEFLKAGIFTADQKNGLPIRKMLRSLDDNKQLAQIPYVIPERKSQNTTWFFGPARTEILINVRMEAVKTLKTKLVTTSSKPRSYSDECYVLDLCDEMLGLNSVRQHRFSFLLGDPNSAGRYTRLPVDAWYKSLSLVIEFNEKQHTERVKHFDKRMTLSGVHRGEQRALYDHRKITVLPQHGIQVLVLSYTDFDHNSRKQLLRNRKEDLKVIREKLKPYLTAIKR